MQTSIAATLAAAFSRHAERIALYEGERAWLYHELDVQAGRLAAGLAQAGIAAGDRVAFLLTNRVELVLLYLACFRLGAVAVPLNVRLTGPELAYVLNHSGARLVVTQPDLYPALATARPELELAGLYQVAGHCPAGVRDFAELFGAAPVPWQAVAAEAPAAILYTSGTTARPKGVTHTGASLFHAVANFVEASGLAGDDVVCGMLPMAHIFGFTLQLLAPLSVGATVAVLPRFEPEAVLDLLARRGVTHLYGLPAMFNGLARAAGERPAAPRRLRYCLAGGDALPRAVSEAMEDRFGVAVHEGCGMTEVIPYALNRPGRENRVGSIGPAMPGLTLRLVDARGQAVADGEAGEVLVRGAAVMAGYWHDPAATAEALEDGWLRTGDRARRDADGYYWFVGRAKDIIVSGGSNISPLEVEDALYGHPAIAEAAVVGVPDAELGERVRAFVALKPGHGVDAAALLAHAASRLAAYKLPESIIFRTELPKGLTGKVQRRALRDWRDGPAPSR